MAKETESSESTNERSKLPVIVESSSSLSSASSASSSSSSSTMTTLENMPYSHADYHHHHHHQQPYESINIAEREKKLSSPTATPPTIGTDCRRDTKLAAAKKSNNFVCRFIFIFAIFFTILSIYFWLEIRSQQRNQFSSESAIQFIHGDANADHHVRDLAEEEQHNDDNIDEIINENNFVYSPSLNDEDDNDADDKIRNDDEAKLQINRRLFVREMIRDAWRAYVQHAWRQDVLKPRTRSSDDRWLGPGGGLTAFHAATTLLVAGMTEEAGRVRDWIGFDEGGEDPNQAGFRFALIDQPVNVFLAVTEVLGPLLSCYALSNDTIFLRQAISVADALRPAYDTDSGLPMKSIIPATGETFGANVHLGELGGQQLEYHYLFRLTGRYEYARRVKRIRSAIKLLHRADGADHARHTLYMNEIDVRNPPIWSSNIATLFRSSSSFYSYLIKSYTQTDHRDVEALQMYRETIEAITRNAMIDRFYPPNKAAEKDNNDDNDNLDYSLVSLQYVRDLYSGQMYGNFMLHDGCYLGAMFALSARAIRSDAISVSKSYQHRRQQEQKQQQQQQQQQNQLYHEANRHWQLATNLTETCRMSAKMTRTGLPPYYLFVDNFNNDNVNGDDDDLIDQDNNPRRHLHQPKTVEYLNEYFLSPELAECYFVLWRTTHDQKYREYAWQLIRSIDAHCRDSQTGAFGSIRNVDYVPAIVDDYQPPHIFATFKYLYLIFAEDEILPLDRWVFNRIAQPLPICGATNDDRCKIVDVTSI